MKTRNREGTQQELIQFVAKRKLKALKGSKTGMIYVTPLIQAEVGGKKYTIEGSLVAAQAGLEPVPGKLNYWRKKGGEHGTQS